MQIAEDIRELIDSHQAAFPTVLEIPSKDHPYGMYRPLKCTSSH